LQHAEHVSVTTNTLTIYIYLLLERRTPDRRRFSEALIVSVREQVHQDGKEVRLKRRTKELASVVVTVLHEEWIPQSIVNWNCVWPASLVDPIVHLDLWLDPRRIIASSVTFNFFPVNLAILGSEVLDLIEDNPSTFGIILPL
jgi:hypothetical protein